MRILVTGSRTFENDVLICDVLWDTIMRHPDPIKSNILVSGACPTGADYIAEYWFDTWGIPIERHEPDWNAYGKAAGPLRNLEMVQLGADICLAFIADCKKPNCPEWPKPHESHGARKTRDWALEYGIYTRTFRGE